VTHRGPFQPLPFCDSVIPSSCPRLVAPAAKSSRSLSRAERGAASPHDSLKDREQRLRHGPPSCEPHGQRQPLTPFLQPDSKLPQTHTSPERPLCPDPLLQTGTCPETTGPPSHPSHLLLTGLEDPMRDPPPSTRTAWHRGTPSAPLQGPER